MKDILNELQSIMVKINHLGCNEKLSDEDFKHLSVANNELEQLYNKLYEQFSKTDGNKEYLLKLNEREKDALFILLFMAQTYSWELYDKQEGCLYWKRHKENIDRIKIHQDKYIQGIMATCSDILGKLNNIG